MVLNAEVHRVPYTLRRNWQEERGVGVTTLADFLQRRERGELEVQRHSAKVEFHNRPIEAGSTSDLLGSPVHLEALHKRLALDYVATDSAGNVSATEKGGNTFRTSFCFHRAVAQAEGNSVLCFGDEVTISPCNPLEHLSLVFHKGSTSNGKGRLRFETDGGRSADWRVLAADGIERELSRGLPVASKSPVILQHCQSGQLLCLEEQTIPNDFGMESCVSAASLPLPGRKKICERSTKGDVMAEIAAGVSARNCWQIIPVERDQGLGEEAI